MPSQFAVKRGALRVSVLVLRVFVSVSRETFARPSVCQFFGTGEGAGPAAVAIVGVPFSWHGGESAFLL